MLSLSNPKDDAGQVKPTTYNYEFKLKQYIMIYQNFEFEYFIIIKNILKTNNQPTFFWVEQLGNIFYVHKVNNNFFFIDSSFSDNKKYFYLFLSLVYFILIILYENVFIL